MPGFLRLGLVIGLGLIARDALPAAAQNDSPKTDRWQLTLDDQRYVWDVRLVRLAGDTLIVRQSDSLVSAPIARIDEMRLLQATTLLVGDGHESAISTLAGDNAKVYDLAGLDFAARRSAIQSILSHYPTDP